ncbi:LOW QUALITY PROTEIN: hypothetical protein ColTof4_08729 [Colletotrichum tofieldiae]|nr:LOW QUALITY PROTEIN: hypothetical protein ColTof3_04067 [Colletotrichum tofieldiae]GKT76306.1 LOW QUALITY PROTEIN: hypothetical protein ColTof4_08729 [Colletotrichum tofieldiae]GKT92463.1 LOW QUALITY PROTEIN: hypothetical protein Ct61P_10313 [Colletotrichum tofieldiae]
MSEIFVRAKYPSLQSTEVLANQYNFVACREHVLNPRKMLWNISEDVYFVFVTWEILNVNLVAHKKEAASEAESLARMVTRIG